ncbi:drug/metabolite transporter (DMT)-like permease [Catenuloplanes nepalensis]|uniref:Drug/metabolite transporter (DMT)-like permease n=1 Tax=Catenuloplanes nepalensis TaxID=587533 RepID=A0ABT9N2P1_9ACTN|nr:DMT family transporter [Catenuloplanes nepalensis]MDP9797950.1 drug/metabolite transporter (DMT)-like permease [Catenuloplanes nepalensis]
MAVVAITTSSPLIAFAAAPGLAIAFWRNALAVGVLTPVAIVRRRAEIRALAGPYRRQLIFCVLSGVALAAHFGTWVPSIKLTSVAAATALVCTQPVWQGLIALGQGRRLPWVTWAGIGVAVAGAAAATGADLGVSGEAVLGDLLAIAGGVFAAVYTALGERARSTLSTTTYTTVCYGVCALVLLAACLIVGVDLGGYPGSTWLAILGLAAGAQLLGHSMFNFALRRVSATTVSILILLEVPGAALIAWAWLGQAPPAATVPGVLLVVVGVAVVVLGGARAQRGRENARAGGAERRPEAGRTVALTTSTDAEA